MKDMKDPIQGTLDAVREVEIRIGQVRILWSEAVAAKEAAEAGAEALRAELQQSCLLSARVQAEAFECRKEMERLRADYGNGVRRELEAAHAAIWGLGCALTEAYADAKSARHARNRLRRSNDRVREVLGAKPGESPVEAAERANQSRRNVEYMGREIERLRAERDKERADWSRLLQDERSALHNTIVGLRGDLENTKGRYEQMVETSERLRAERDSAKAIMGREIERFRNERDAALGRVVKLEKARKEGEQDVQALRESIAAVRAERDKALARVEELEREVSSLRSLVPVDGEVRSMNVCCCSARQVARNECAAALFEILRPGAEPPQQGAYVFSTALAEVAKELSALRKDRETLNRVRGAVEVKS